ncbi:gustatory receptor 64a [Mizuhopecten yessoensis]|uniref:Gustatory receptor 64a n=1 Tax=Mizuhopecten yessoensis TaxID=6573 RepID=A0A210QE02_MIZYE|nr:gustatory receptor 64a [Mizuhopecten yessoensis]
MTDTCCMDIKLNSNRSRKYSIFFVIVALLIILLNVGASIYYIITQAASLVTVCNPFSAKSTAVQIFFVALNSIEMGAWIFPVIFLVALFKILSDQFTSYTNVFCKMTKDEGKNVWQKMKDIRLKHLQLCKAVDILEQDTKYLIAGNYVTNIFLICFIVYQMVASNSAVPVLGYITFSIWLVMNFSIMASLSITAAQVNEEAHSSLQYIYDVEMDEVSRSEALQIQLFLSKLNGPAIGFTVMGLITITKEFILTLAGFILTYLFLLLQFNI